MKQYLFIAVLLGVIAFASVSFLAHADQQSTVSGAISPPPKTNGNAKGGGPLLLGAPVDNTADKGGDNSDGEADSDKAAAAADAAAAKYEKDETVCVGSTQPDEIPAFKKGIDFRSCMLGKQHTQMEIKAATDAENAADAAQTDTHDQGDRAPE